MSSWKRASDVLAARTLSKSGQRTLTSGPSTIVDLVDIWFDADNVNLLHNTGIASGSNIALWKNASAAGAIYDAAQGNGALQPTITANSLLGTSSISGTNTSFLKASNSPFTANIARTLWFVVKTPAIPSAFLFATNDLAGYATIWSPDKSGFEEGGNPDPTVCRIPAPPDGDSICLIKIKFSGVTTDLPSCRVNGVNQLVTQVSGVGVGTEVFTNSFYPVYRFQGGGCAQIAGKVGVINPAKELAVDQYFNSRYGLAA